MISPLNILSIWIKFIFKIAERVSKLSARNQKKIQKHILATCKILHEIENVKGNSYKREKAAETKQN